MTTTTDLPALIAAAEANLEALLYKTSHQAHTKADLHRVHFAQAELQQMRNTLADQLAGVVHEDAPRPPLAMNEYQVLVVAASLGTTSNKAICAAVAVERKALGQKYIAADMVAERLQLLGMLTGTRKGTDVTLTELGQSKLAAAAAYYAE